MSEQRDGAIEAPAGKTRHEEKFLDVVRLWSSADWRRAPGLLTRPLPLSLRATEQGEDQTQGDDDAGAEQNGGRHEWRGLF